MLSRPRILAVGVILVTLWIFIGFTRLGNFELFELVGDTEQPNTPRPRIDLSKDDFIAAAISSAVEDDYDYGYIMEMCDDQRWDPTVVFECQNLIGGIGNLRQEILHCIRYAIDAGAGIVLPVIHLRSESDLSNLESGTTSMDYLFDQERFLFRIRTACPQMTIYQNLDELKAVGEVTRTKLIDPKKLSHPVTSRIAYSCKDRIKEIRAPPGQISLVPLENLWRHFPICHDPVGFAETFGNLLPLRRDVHRLAATALYEMYSRYDLAIDPYTTTTLPHADSFIGIHLRTANDILSYWLGYDDQAKYYISRMEASEYVKSLPIVYIASGNATSITDFDDEQADSLTRAKRIVTKNDLLSGADQAELAGLTWDQQALVDYLVLSRSGYFMGMADSSFAWTIAVNRRKSTASGTCGLSKGWWKSKFVGAALRDEFSDLMGYHGYGWEDKMWP